MSTPEIYRGLCLDTIETVLEGGAPESMVIVCRDILRALRSEQLPALSAPPRLVEQAFQLVEVADIPPIEALAIAPAPIMEPEPIADPEPPHVARPEIAETPPHGP